MKQLCSIKERLHINLCRFGTFIKITRFILLLLAFLSINREGHAQITTSSVSGIVNDSKGETLPGATVMIENIPTGRKFGTITNSDGRYYFADLNPGGPYEITVSFIGFQTSVKQNIYLKLGETFKLNLPIIEQSTQLNEVMITANVDDRKSGTGNRVGKEQIATLPTLTRSFSDMLRTTPQSSNNSFAGTNFRYNNITLDGAINNDAISFSPSLGGISGTSNQPGSSTRTNSFSSDALQEVQVQIAPYDVTIGNFTGGSINAVSKSGSNEIEGSIYGFGRNALITGKYRGADKNGDGSVGNGYKDYQYGIRLGLPIVKNKLFFFTNVEMTNNELPLSFPAGSTNYFLSKDDAQKIVQKLMNLPATQFNTMTGYDPGTFEEYSDYSKSSKFFNRIDWNINKTHSLTIRNNTVLSEATNLERGSTEFQFGNFDFRQFNKNTSTVAELKSRFGDKFSNSLIVGYTYIHDYREPKDGVIFPQIQINNVNGGTILLGTNRESGVFDMKQKTIEITDNLKIFIDNHKLTFGTHNELYKIQYGFVNSWNGRFDYNSLNDFLNDKPSRMRYEYNPIDNSRQYNVKNNPAIYNVDMLSAYGQDEWYVNNKLTVTYGLRADMIIVPETPTTAAYGKFPDAPSNYGKTYTIDNKMSGIDNKYFGKIVLSPRIGFNYDVKGDNSLILRGGTGIFTGRIPLSWLGYAFYNNGVSYSAIDYKPSTATYVPIPTNPVQFKDFAISIGAGGRSDMCVIDNDFQMPKIWRSTLATDINLPGNYMLTLEGIYSKTIKDVMIKQINLKDSVYYANYDINHQQPLYLSGGTTAGRSSNNFNSLFLLTNTNKGYRYQLTAQIRKNYNFGLNIMAAYTYGQSKDMLNGIRNSYSSSWQTTQALNPNNPVLSYSNFDIRHRIVSTVVYQNSWNMRNKSYISLIFTAESGSPFTWVIGSNNLTRNTQQIDLAFIPATIGQINIADKKNSNGVVTETAAQQWIALDDFIKSDKYLTSRRGKFTERNGGRTPWNNRMDIRLMHDYSFKVGNRNNTLQFTLDIINFTNLLNKDWGNVYYTPNTINSSVNTGLSVTRDATKTAEPQYTFTKPSATYSVDQFSSRWQAQVGVRYSF